MENNNSLFMPMDHMEKLYNSSNFLVRFIHNNRLNHILKFILQYSNPKAKILDAGCGEGHLLKKIDELNNNYSLFGIDCTNVAIAKAKERCSTAIIANGELEKTNYENNYFDIITCTEVIEHIINYELVFEELQRILKKDGLLIITFPNEFLWTFCRFLLRRKPLKVPDHVNSFNPKFIINKLKLKLVSSKNLPFNAPFIFSLGTVLVFKKNDD